MAEINRAEELTPEEEQTVDTNEESSIQELVPEEESALTEGSQELEEKGPEPDEKIGQQGEEEKFNPERRKEEIEARYQERSKRCKEIIKEIFGNEENPKDSGDENYLGTLLEARRKEKTYEENPKITQGFSRAEELSLALDKKRKEIEWEQSEAMKELNQKKQEDIKRRIGEI